MNIAMIAAVGKNGELGKNNKLIWHFKEDMAFFRETTIGCTVIMGRQTFESLPKALPGRKNIVISSNPAYAAPGAVVARSPEQALMLAEGERVFIIGGASVYKAFLPKADTIYLTEIAAESADADTFFPAFDKTKYQEHVLNRLTADGTELIFKCYTKK